MKNTPNHLNEPARAADRILLTGAEGSARTRMSERTLRRWAAVGKLPAYRLGGRLLYDSRDIEALIVASAVQR